MVPSVMPMVVFGFLVTVMTTVVVAIRVTMRIALGVSMACWGSPGPRVPVIAGRIPIGSCVRWRRWVAMTVIDRS